VIALPALLQSFFRSILRCIIIPASKPIKQFRRAGAVFRIRRLLFFGVDQSGVPIGFASGVLGFINFLPPFYQLI
jgi:hypothetical protein